jgi:diguanylate cyclase (GGDEF)-like protein
MFIDLDNFKQINDTLGHPAGDFILKKTGLRLTDSVRDSDVVARIGGDEFLVIIPNLSSHEEAELLASKLIHIFEQPFYFQQTEFFVSSSIGMSIYPDDGSTTDDLLAHADTAMYQVKEEGRNGFRFYNANMNQDVERNLEIDARLRQAVTANQLDIYYQPIVNLSNDKIIGAEALLRWNDEKLGAVSPEEFILIAERNGLIHKLGELALNSACKQAAQWQSIQPLSIAVNFSCMQFRQHDLLLDQIKSALENSGLAANLLDIEITESLMFNHSAATIKLLDQLHNMGTQLSIDDFGTGYSALSYLQKFPFNKLKIDRSFLIDLETNPSSKELVNAIVAMAKALGLKVVAEGVESEWDRDYLKQQNCDFAQGFFYSHPIPADEFERLLVKQNSDG